MRCPNYSPGGELKCVQEGGHPGPCLAPRIGIMNPGYVVKWTPVKSTVRLLEAPDGP